MIIRRQSLSQNSTDDGNEISIDLARLAYIARKKARLLAAATLLGFGLGLIYPMYKLSKPVQTRLETEILFVGNAGVTGVTGVTGVKEIDSALSTFDPQINLPTLIQNWRQESFLEVALTHSQVKVIDSRRNPKLGVDQNLSEKWPQVFLVNDQSGRRAHLLIDFQFPRNRPVRMIIQGAFPLEKLKLVGDNILFALNELWSQKALELARTQVSYAEKVRTQLAKEPAGAVEELPLLARSIQITADLSLLSNYHRVRLIDQFLRKLANWPPKIIFVYKGKQTWEEVLPSRGLLILPIILGTGFLFGLLGFNNFFGEMAGKVLGERDLADIHPAASVYPTKLASADLIHLLAASFARAGQDKLRKLAAFVPQTESRLMETIRSAAERAGHSFANDSSDHAEVCLFQTDNPSSMIARLPSCGIGRILLISKKGESLKSRHKLYQAEADLAGVPITDVVLIED